MHAAATTVAPTLPIAVQLGFAGSRLLYGGERIDAAQAARLDEALVAQLSERLRELPARLGLAPWHFLCGVSQVAIGADTVFSRALHALGAAQRVLLPQGAESYLNASDAGEPDFTPAERDAARALLASPRVIEVRVASEADERGARFEDTNLAILHESDAIVCLLREGALARGEPASARAGGTRDLMQRAARAGKPVLLLEVAMRDGQPVLSPWHLPAQTSFVPPGMPAELRGLAWPASAGGVPTAGDYIECVRRFASAKTRQHSGLFKRAAFAIILLHIVATLLAVLAGQGRLAWWVAALLAVELVLLGAGLRTHHALHRSATARGWASTRLLAEILRSMKSVCATAVSLDYTRSLALPAAFGPLLRTAAVMHGLETRQRDAGDWPVQRARYLDERLAGAHGQRAYFERAARAAARRHAAAHTGFWLFSVAAFAATGAKLASVAGVLPAPVAPWVAAWGGLLAIVLPVAAVGFLSWAAASDLEARAATYAEMHAFVSAQAERVREAATARDFARAVRETELGILGENLGWFSRRLFKGVA